MAKTGYNVPAGGGRLHVDETVYDPPTEVDGYRMPDASDPAALMALLQAMDDDKAGKIGESADRQRSDNKKLFTGMRSRADEAHEQGQAAALRVAQGTTQGITDWLDQSPLPSSVQVGDIATVNPDFAARVAGIAARGAEEERGTLAQMLAQGQQDMVENMALRLAARHRDIDNMEAASEADINAWEERERMATEWDAERYMMFYTQVQDVNMNWQQLQIDLDRSEREADAYEYDVLHRDEFTQLEKDRIRASINASNASAGASRASTRASNSTTARNLYEMGGGEATETEPPTAEDYYYELLTAPPAQRMARSAQSERVEGLVMNEMTEGITQALTPILQAQLAQMATADGPPVPQDWMATQIDTEVKTFMNEFFIPNWNAWKDNWRRLDTLRESGNEAVLRASIPELYERITTFWPSAFDRYFASQEDAFNSSQQNLRQTWKDLGEFADFDYPRGAWQPSTAALVAVDVMNRLGYMSDVQINEGLRTSGLPAMRELRGDKDREENRERQERRDQIEASERHSRNTYVPESTIDRSQRANPTAYNSWLAAQGDDEGKSWYKRLLPFWG